MSSPNSTAAQVDLGKRVRAARSAVGLSQRELADHVGMSRVAVAEVEAGRRRLSSFELAGLCRAVQQSPEYFLGRLEAEEVFGAAPDQVAHLARTAKQLTVQDQQQLLQFAEYLRSQARRR